MVKLLKWSGEQQDEKPFKIHKMGKWGKGTSRINGRCGITYSSPRIVNRAFHNRGVYGV